MARAWIIWLLLMGIASVFSFPLDEHSPSRYCEPDDVCGFEPYNDSIVRECLCHDGESCIKIPPIYRFGGMIEVNWRYCVHPHKYLKNKFPIEKQRNVSHFKKKRKVQQRTMKPPLAPKRKKKRKKKGWVTHRVHY